MPPVVACHPPCFSFCPFYSQTQRRLRTVFIPTHQQPNRDLLQRPQSSSEYVQSSRCLSSTHEHAVAICLTNPRSMDGRKEAGNEDSSQPHKPTRCFYLLIVNNVSTNAPYSATQLVTSVTAGSAAVSSDPNLLLGCWRRQVPYKRRAGACARASAVMRCTCPVSVWNRFIASGAVGINWTR